MIKLVAFTKIPLVIIVNGIVKLDEIYPRELSSVGRDIAYFMQEPRFEPRTLHFFTIKLSSSH